MLPVVPSLRHVRQNKTEPVTYTYDMIPETTQFTGVNTDFWVHVDPPSVDLYRYSLVFAALWAAMYQTDSRSLATVGSTRLVSLGSISSVLTTKPVVWLPLANPVSPAVVRWNASPIAPVWPSVWTQEVP